MDVSPTVKKYKRVVDIISAQGMIVKEYKSSFNRFKQSNLFNLTEIEYMGGVYKNLFDKSLQSLDELRVAGLGRNVGVNEADAECERLPLGEVRLDELRPLRGNRLRDLRVAVAWKVSEDECRALIELLRRALVQREEVDRSRTAGCGRNHEWRCRSCRSRESSTTSLATRMSCRESVRETERGSESRCARGDRCR